jgi:choline dehydrogenase-like flavoprotein
VSGLRVADTSVFPYVTSRGPAATAIMVGERLAALIQSESASTLDRQSARAGKRLDLPAHSTNR